MNVGYVGLGNMGGPLARRIMRAHRIRAYDLRPEVTEAFAREGAVPAQNPAALARECDTVFTCLPTSAEVRAAIFGPDGLAEGLAPGSIVADMTTGDPNATKAMAAELAERGIHLIDSPVSGGPQGANAGTIAIMVGGPEELFRRVRPVLEAISPNIFHCGGVGAGHTMKLVNNVISACVRTVTFEAVTMGVKNGLSLAACAEVLDKGSAHSFTTQHTLPKLVDGSMKAHFGMKLMHKDVRLATQLGLESGAPMPVANLVREIFQTAVNTEGADADVNELIRLIERNAGVTVVGA